MKESELVCEDHGISNLAKPAKQCVAGEIRENGKSDAFLESRGLTQ